MNATVVAALLEEHRTYLGDTNRLAAYVRALATVVRPRDVVVDLGAGTGVLGILALRAGAARVYAIDAGRMVPIARSMYAANGFADRVTVIKGHSTDVTLPERADVVVADQMGPLGIEAGLLEYFADARARMLKPNGRLVPERLELFVAAISGTDVVEDLHMVCASELALDLEVMRRWASNESCHRSLRADALLGPPECASTIVLGDSPESSRTLTVDLAIAQDGVLCALGAWFRADLGGGVAMSNSPLDTARIDRPQIIFPLASSHEVKRGDRVAVVIDARPSANFYRWRATVASQNGEVRARFDTSTLASPLLTADALHRTHPSYSPKRNVRADARLFVLSQCDGAHPVSGIERELLVRFPTVCRTPRDAAAFVARVIDHDVDR